MGSSNPTRYRLSSLLPECPFKAQRPSPTVRLAYLRADLQCEDGFKREMFGHRCSLYDRANEHQCLADAM
jgi:hypothetical protein